jgi:hypothetical protein
MVTTILADRIFAEFSFHKPGDYVTVDSRYVHTAEDGARTYFTCVTYRVPDEPAAYDLYGTPLYDYEALECWAGSGPQGYQAPIRIR